MNKKALMAPMFKYIFVVFTGAIILTFFIYFANKEISTADTLNSAILTRTLDNAFAAFSISNNADKTVRLGSEYEIFFNKNNICNTLTVKDSVPARLKDPIFSPNKLKGTTMDIWTHKFKYPFEVNSLFYLSNENTKIILVGSNELVKELKGKLRNNGDCCLNNEFIPKRFNIEIRNKFTQSDINTLENLGLIKIIFIDTKKTISSQRNIRVTEITTNNCREAEKDSDCHGTVSFNNQITVFFGKAMLYAAIFSEDFQNYQCGLKKTFERFNIVIDIYQSKINSMSNSECQLYTSLSNNLASMKNKLTSDSNNLKNLNSEEYNSIKDSIIKSNKDLMGDKNCEAVF